MSGLSASSFFAWPAISSASFKSWATLPLFTLARPMKLDRLQPLLGERDRVFPAHPAGEIIDRILAVVHEAKHVFALVLFRPGFRPAARIRTEISLLNLIDADVNKLRNRFALQ